MSSLASLLTEVRACTLCAEHLPLGPRPIIQADESARILIVGQAPGRKVHETGIGECKPWNPSHFHTGKENSKTTNRRDCQFKYRPS